MPDGTIMCRSILSLVLFQLLVIGIHKCKIYGNIYLAFGSPLDHVKPTLLHLGATGCLHHERIVHRGEKFRDLQDNAVTTLEFEP